MGRDDPHAPPPRPRMAVHVGAAGHRTLPDADTPALFDAAAAVFRTLREAAWHLHAADKTATPPLYSPDPPLLRCLCGVADGADSILAEAAIAEGWSLTAVLPFPRREFERDFTTAPALERHRALIGRAEQVVEFDGSRERGGEPYAEVAEQIVEQSDLVLVIWDGLPPRGPGGTGELVQQAMNAGRPVGILPSTGPATLNWTSATQDAASLLKQFLLPPTDADASLRLYYGQAGRRGRWAAAAVRFYERAVLIGTHLPRPHYSPVDTPPPNPVLQAYFEQADRLANAYAARFRLAGLLRYGLILPATAGAFFALFGPVWVRTGGYAVQAVALGIMVVLTMSGGWERSQRLFVAYRALAEYLRNTVALAPLRAMAKVPGETAHQARAVNWPEWYGRAVVRQIGLQPGFIGTAEVAAAASVLRNEVAGQVAFLTGRAARFAAMARRLKRIGVSLSLCGIILGGVRLGVILEGGTDRSTLLVNELALVLPSLAPVFLGLLGFGEYGRLAGRYSALAEELVRQLAALERAEPKRAAVLRIGRRMTDAMLAESADWQLLIKARILSAFLNAYDRCVPEDRTEAMRVILKDGVMVVVPETAAERAEFADWCAALDGHVFALRNASASGGSLHDLGLQEDACREPINVVFDLVAPQWQPISNLAATPFMMDGRHYASVEGFWQGLKFPDQAERARIAVLSGKAAKNAARKAPDQPSFIYGGDTMPFGGPSHHALMRRACEAKFTQHLIARESLLSTGDRPLVHRIARDSKTIPGALMADIWMRLRDKLRAAS